MVLRYADYSASISLKRRISTWVFHLGVLGDSILSQPNISQTSHSQPEALPNPTITGTGSATQVKSLWILRLNPVYLLPAFYTVSWASLSELFTSVGSLEVLQKQLQARPCEPRL